MKVLHFGRFFPGTGGLEQHVSLLLPGLAKEFHIDNLVAGPSLQSDVMHGDGYRVYRAASFGIAASTALSPALLAQARRLQARHRYDILHLHFPDPLSHLAAMTFPAGVKRIVAWHSDIVRQRFLLRFYQPWLKRFLDSADAVVVATPRHIETSPLLSRLPAEKLKIIPYGLDYRLFADPRQIAAGMRLRQALGGRRLLFAIGRHVYYKGFSYLIAAMAALPPDVHLLLAGSGPLSAELKEQSRRLGLDGRITFLGRISEEEKAAHYHACDVFCMPSVAHAEAFGLVQLEAMACAKPVVCCELGNGTTYVNRHGVTGWVVPPQDPQALAGALETLLGDAELRARLGQAGRQRAIKAFSQAAMVEKTAALYRSL